MTTSRTKQRDLRKLAFSDWPAEARDEFEERAAIVEEGCKVPRSAAESQALCIVAANRARMERERRPG